MKPLSWQWLDSF